MTKEEKLQEIRDKIFHIRYDSYEMLSHQPGDYHMSPEEYDKKLDDLKLEEVYRFQDYEDVMAYDGEWDKHGMVDCYNFDDYSWMKEEQK